MKIYLPFCGLGLGHASRILALAEELKRRGHGVFLCTYDPAYQQIRNLGYEVWKSEPEIGPFNALSSYNFGVCIRRYFLCSMRNFLRAPSMLRTQIRYIKKFDPDLVVNDGHVAALLVTSLLRKKCLFILNQSKITPPSFSISYQIPATITGFSFKVATRLAYRILVPDFPPPYTICRENLETYGREDKFVFVGPMIKSWSKIPGAQAVASERQEPQEEGSAKAFFEEMRKVGILVSLGGEYEFDLTPQIREIAQKRDLRFTVINSGREGREENVTFRGFVKDPLPYLRNSQALITHGGHTTLMEAINLDIPVIGITVRNSLERERNLRSMERYGLGIILEPKEVKDKLEWAIGEILQEKYQLNLKKFRESVREYDGVQKVADMVEEFAENLL